MQVLRLMGGSTHCRWCEQDHDERYLCDSIKRLVDALYARGTELTFPDVTFPEPIPGHELGLGLDVTRGDALMAQVVVQAGCLDLDGVAKPALILTGLDTYRRPMPKWLFAGDPLDLDRTVRLVQRMAALAIRTARQQNRSAS